MKKIFLFFLAASFSFPMQTGATEESSESIFISELQSKKKLKKIDKTTYWNEMADGMVQALTKHFWGANFQGYPNRYYFNYESDLSNMTTNHYWPQAHAMDVIVDAYMRTSEKQYLDFYPLWWKGAPEYNFSGKEIDSWWNE